jgi:hypothetical protein
VFIQLGKPEENRDAKVWIIDTGATNHMTDPVQGQLGGGDREVREGGVHLQDRGASGVRQGVFHPQAHSKYHECGAPQPKWVQCAHGLWQAGDQGTWMEASHDGEDNSLMVVPSHCEVVISGVSGGAK